MTPVIRGLRGTVTRRYFNLSVKESRFFLCEMGLMLVPA